MTQENNHIMQSYTDVLVVNDGAGGGHEYRGIAPIHVDNLDDVISADCKPIVIHSPLSGNLSDEAFELGFENNPFSISNDTYTNQMNYNNNIVSTSAGLQGTYASNSIVLKNSDNSYNVSINSNPPTFYMKQNDVSVLFTPSILSDIKNNVIYGRIYDNSVTPSTTQVMNTFSFTKTQDQRVYIGSTDTEQNAVGGYLDTTDPIYYYTSVATQVYRDFVNTSSTDVLTSAFVLGSRQLIQGTLYVDGVTFDNTTPTCHGTIAIKNNGNEIAKTYALYEWKAREQGTPLQLSFIFKNETNNQTSLDIELYHPNRVIEQSNITVYFNGFVK